MKTPGPAYQFISIQCAVNTYCEERSKVSKKIIFKYIGWEPISNTAVEPRKGTWSAQY